MRENWVRQRLRDGEAVIGVQVGLGSPNVAELLAHAGFDWLVLETEHGAVDSAQLEHMLMAVDGTPAIPLIRPSHGVMFEIQKGLDIGAMGVFVPMVRTAAEAEAIVKATRYPPEGTRGFGPLRASRYSMDYPDYFARANQNMLVSFVLETKEALANLEEIMAVPGVDALCFGLFDLCISLGLNPMEMPFPEVEAEIDRAVEAGRKAGVAVGVGVASPDELHRRLDQGLRFIPYGTDYMLLAGAAKQGLDAFHRRRR
jgi:2-keto-3-deoxy-L-rhamnonate aldolase RhmA